jgi:hypothetical protein
MRDTIEMAREAGIEEAYSLQHGQYLVRFKEGSLERFEALIRADEREANAKVCDDVPVNSRALDWGRFVDGAEKCADAIRARNKE